MEEQADVYQSAWRLEQADVDQSAWRLEQADVYEADTEQTEAERTERARRQYLSHYERRQALPEVFPSARIKGLWPWGCHKMTYTLQNN